MPDEMKAFGQRLRQLREERHLLQKDMAAVLDCTTNNYQKMEYGDVNVPGKNLLFLADYFDVSLDYLTGRSDVRAYQKRAAVDVPEILAHVDHTLLSQGATWEEIRALCDDGVGYGCASVCIPPSYVRAARDYLGDKLPVCTVIGFPNGYATTAAKCFEAAEAAENGAGEIDMVINIGWAKDSRWEDLLGEIRAVREAVPDRILKVIIETCLLTEAEKIRLCEIVSASGADFIKTSTGFAGGGATRADVALFAAHVAPGVKIKAAGGIASLQDAADFLALGASRLGTSRIVKLVKEMEHHGN